MTLALAARIGNLAAALDEHRQRFLVVPAVWMLHTLAAFLAGHWKRSSSTMRSRSV